MYGSKPFSQPQLQSPVGILLIFVSSAYKSLRGLWVLGAYIIFGKISEKILDFIVVGAVLLAVGLIIFSFLSYKRFVFHIDYDKSQFILNQGVFNSSQTAIPFDRIQQVYFKRNLLQRLINVYEVVIDTAGSNAEEVKIKALSRKKADRLQEALMQEVEVQSTFSEDAIINKSESIAETVQQQKPLWKYSLSIGTLIRLGLSTNYLRGVWVLLLFAGSILQQLDTNLLDEDYNAQIENAYDTYITTDYTITLLLIALPLIFVIGIVITTAEIFIKYYGLQLTRTANDLQLEMGLRTNTRVTLKARRVQVFTININPVQRYLNLFNVQLALANSTDATKKSKIKIPGLPAEIVSKVRNFLFEVPQSENKAVFKPHSLLFIRHCLVGLLPLFIGLLAWYVFLDYFIWNFILLVVLIYLPIMVFIKWYAYKAIRLEFSDEFLIKKTGLWNKKTEIIAIYKLQSVTIKQPFWYEKRDLFNLIFHTASGDIAFSAVDGEILKYINYSIYKIETSEKPWM
jgi:putative membrane protein